MGVVDAGKAVVLKYYEEVWDRHRTEAIAELFAAGYVNHAGSRGTLAGPQGIKANYDSLLAAFSDVRFSLDDVLADGDKVIVRYTMHATHSGLFQGVSATGRAVTVPGIGIYRVEAGQIQESWVMRDSLVLLRQIGAVDL